MILLIDNYDSFVHNLARYVRRCGFETRVLRNDQVSIADIRASMPSAVLISPGPCTPNEAGISLELVRELAGEIPLLGICLGHQAIGQAFVGKVIRAPELMHGKASNVSHDSKTIFAGMNDPFLAGRYHSLIVEKESLPSSLEISARTADGVIMGLRHRELKVEGVQFHPESILTSEGKQLLANFLKL